MEPERLRIPLDFYPVVISQSRYGGVYEGGSWFCIPRCDSIPEAAVGSDEECVDFWYSEVSSHIGVGDSPNEALISMFEKNESSDQESFKRALQKLKDRVNESLQPNKSNKNLPNQIERTDYFKHASGFSNGETS